MFVLFIIAAGMVITLSSAAVAYRMTHPDRRTYGYALARGMGCDPSELGLTAQAREFKFDDGTTTSAWLIEGGCPTGPTVIMTHGWSSSRYWSLNKSLRLVPYASRVLVYDMRGHGDATGRTSTLGVKEPDDLIRIMNELDCELEGGEREGGGGVGGGVVLYGSSMGAGITLQAAATDFSAGHDRILSVVVEGPYRHAMGPIALHLQRLRWPAQPVAWFAHGMVHLALGRPRGKYDRAGLAGQLRCPLFVLHGSDDPICPVAGGREIAEAAEQGELIEFPGGVHGGLSMLDPLRYDAALARAMGGPTDTGTSIGSCKPLKF